MKKYISQQAGHLHKATQDLALRVPPHSLEAEQAVLAGLLLRKTIAPQVIADLKAEDFYFPQHKEIFLAAHGLYVCNSAIDLITLAQVLKDTNKLEEIGGAVYLAELAQLGVSAANAEFYAKIVHEKSIQRGLIEAGSTIVSSGFDSSRELSLLIDEAEQAIMHVSSRKNTGAFKPVNVLIGGLLDAAMQPAENGITGLPTGYKDLDRITRGLQPSDLIIIAARPAMGKTAFALNLAMRAAITQKATVGIFSLEMSDRQLIQRMASLWGKIPYDDLCNGHLGPKEGDRLFQATEFLQKAPLYINETPALTTLELRSQARRLKMEHGLDLIIVDYLQLLRSTRRTDSRELEISDISRALKALAKELNVPVIALSQLNRKLEERADKRPLLADLRESGAIEQDADLVVFIYRDEVYNKKEDNPKKGIAELIIGKHRNGRTGIIELAFLPQYTAFEELSK